MNRQEFNIEFVDKNFSIAKSGACPKCNTSICFLPVIKSLIKEDSKNMINLLKDIKINVSMVERISVKEWTCNTCNTIFINIEERQITFK